jgi:asparagine synthase (glutamine-hydrolysing)
LSAYSVFAADEIKRLTGFDDLRSASRVRYLYELLGCSRRTEAVERMMALDMRLNLSDDLLLYTDKVTMYHSIECRVPMLDLELVRFVESLPYHYRVRLRQGKVIHKSFAEKALPATIIHRQKKGFQSPTRSWFSKGNVVRDILLDRSSRFSNFFNSVEVAKVLDEHAKGFDRDRHIFLLLNLHYWIEQYA